MPRRVIEVLHTEGDTLWDGTAAIERELGLTSEFSEEVERAARQAAGDPRLPALDRTDIPFVTLDAAIRTELDRALQIERDARGFVLHYAVADVAAFVSPGDPLDEEANRRGETMLGAGSKVPLHPSVISEGAASLLPGANRPALLWTVKIDEDGEGTDVKVERALVRSRARLDYEGVQKGLDAGTADDTIVLLAEVGELRKRREAGRGGVSLPLPERQVDVASGTWTSRLRSMLPVQSWHEQVSLLVGMAAASMMVYARVGLLRTLPPPDHRDVQRLHRTARALDIEWPAEQLYPDLIRSLDPDRPRHAAMVLACVRLLSGSGYVAFNGETPEQPEHALLASEYAHVTAPLRRLADRYAGEVCVALSAGVDVPAWVLERLGGLPATMRASDRTARQYEDAVLDLVQAAVLGPRVGEIFPGVVVEVDEDDTRRGDVVVPEPAVAAEVRSGSDLSLGAQVAVHLVEADLTTRTVRFEV